MIRAVETQVFVVRPRKLDETERRIALHLRKLYHQLAQRGTAAGSSRHHMAERVFHDVCTRYSSSMIKLG